MINDSGNRAALGDGQRRDNRAVEPGGNGLVGIDHIGARIIDDDGKAVRKSRSSADYCSRGDNGRYLDVVNVVVLVGAAGSSREYQLARRREIGGLVIGENLASLPEDIQLEVGGQN